jgi:hypothetical protein
MKKRCEPSMQIERGISRPSSIRHQSHLTLIVEIMPDRQHTMRAVPIGAGGSAPDVRQGALGGRRARLDVVTSGSGSGRAFPARPRTQGRVIRRISRVGTACSFLLRFGFIFKLT